MAVSPCWLRSRPSCSSSAETRSGMIRSVTLKRIADPINAKAQTPAEPGCAPETWWGSASQPPARFPSGGRHPWRRCRCRSADHAADSVAGENVERVVERRLRFPVDGQVAHDAGEQTDHDALADGDVACRRGDRHQADHRADAGAQGRRLRPRIQSKNIQPSIAAAEAVLVVPKAIAAVPLAASAEPALNPNQPNQSMPVPQDDERDVGRRCVSLATWLFRRPRIRAPGQRRQTRPTCGPPCRRRNRARPILRKPSGCQVQCASGQ